MKKILTYFLGFTLLALVATSCKDDKDKDSVSLDYTEINELLTESQTLLSDAKGVNKHLFTDESIDTFEEVVDSTAAFITRAEAKYQSTITTRTTTLKTAKETFEKSALNIIDNDKALILGITFDNDTIANLVYTNGVSKPTVNLENGPKEITTSSKPSYISRGKGKAMYFSKGSHLALTDYVSDDFLHTTMSFSAWVRLDEMNANNYIVSLNYRNNWSLKIDEKGRVVFNFVTTEDGGATTAKIEANSGDSKFIAAGQWAHIVVAIDLKSDEHKLTFHINGQKVKEYTVAELPALAGTVAGRYISPTGKDLPLMVGAATTYEEASSQWTGTWNTEATWSCMRGAIDNLAIYKTALRDLQIDKLYNDEK